MGRGSRNNVLAGLLVIGAIVVSLVVVALLGGLRDSWGKEPRIVRFSVADGVTGLKKGSEVRMGGLRVGLVDSVSPVVESDLVTGMEVRISVDPGMAPLREGAVAYLETALLGSASNINFSGLGAGRLLTATDVIPGKLAPPGFLAAAGYGDEQKTAVQRIIANVDTGIAKFNSTMVDFEGRRGKWFDDFDAITTNGRELMAAANKATPDIIKKVQDAADEVKALMADGRKLVADNRPGIDAAIANTKEFSEQLKRIGTDGEQIAQRIRTTTVGMVEDVLTDARARVNEAGTTLNSALTKADDLLSEQTPVVRSAMAKLRLTGDQLAATLAEVRRSPWRLVYRPDKRDLEFELLYDSARTYAQAVSDLSSAAEAVKGLSDAGGGNLKAGERNVNELLDGLGAAFTKYEEAESEFLRQVKSRAK